MSNLSINEDDFTLIVSAANTAYTNGDIEEAEQLDTMARKMNASLTRARCDWHHKVSWENMPSCLLHNVAEQVKEILKDTETNDRI